MTYGGRKRTGIDVIEWVQNAKDYGAGEILLTSMDRDGTKEGFDNKLTRSVSSSISIPVIASGGVGNLQHLVDGIKEGGAEAVLAASIFHYSEFTIQQAKSAMLESGLDVRVYLNLSILFLSNLYINGIPVAISNLTISSEFIFSRSITRALSELPYAAIRIFEPFSN